MLGIRSRTVSLSFLLALTYSCFLLESVTAIDANAVNADKSEQIWVGVAKVDVTPTIPVVLAGYGGRTKPYEAIDTKLWARALVIGKDEPVAIVVLDNCGVTRKVTRNVRKILSRQGFKDEHVIVATTHTHNAPNLEGYAPILWQGRMTLAQQKETSKYTEWVTRKMAEAVIKARDSKFRAQLSWGQGRVTFGGNRRVIRDGRWAGFGFQFDAPVDHSLPVLVARDEQNRVRAVWANYACHCTTIGSRNSVAGDWAGFANESIERQFTNSVSLVSIGCGADVGPQPSGSLEVARTHGASLAAEVKRMVEKNELEKLNQTPTVRTEIVDLPLEKPKPKSHWEKQAQTRSFERQLAIKMLSEIESNGKIADTVEYPITSWTFGKQLAMVFLPGEVVVDYSVRLKTELDWQRLWITAWSNGMPGYIPSKKVLMQGGYEADFSQTYYGLPGRYQPEVEDLVVNQVRSLVGQTFSNAGNKAPSPFHKPPSREEITFKNFRERLKSLDADQKRVVQQVAEWIPSSQGGLRKIAKGSWGKDQWFNLYGDRVDRSFIRQEKNSESIRWESGEVAIDSQGIFCFTGGLGWISQPESNGFELKVNGDRVVFDVVKAPKKWTSTAKSFQLYYLPTWISNEDSAGFFFVAIRDLPIKSKPITFSVRSLSSGSKRWFGLDVKQNLKADLKKLGPLINSIQK